MARARNIKPTLFLNEYFGVCDPLETLFFIGLWCLADREGRVENRPSKLKAELFPYRSLTAQEITRMIANLSKRGFLILYTVENRNYIQITGFLEHQNPHKNEKPSRFPAPSEKTITCKCSSNYASSSDFLGNAPADSHDSHDSLIPDSHDSLIPDSLIPAFPAGDPGKAILSGNPDGDQKADKQESKTKQNKKRSTGKSLKPNGDATAHTVEAVINHLNQKTGSRFTAAESNAKLIRARISEGATQETMCAVIDQKFKEWGSQSKMRQFLRPSTLFNAEKFNQYAGQLDLKTESDDWDSFFGTQNNSNDPKDIDAEVIRHG